MQCEACSNGLVVGENGNCQGQCSMGLYPTFSFDELGRISNSSCTSIDLLLTFKTATLPASSASASHRSVFRVPNTATSILVTAASPTDLA